VLGLPLIGGKRHEWAEPDESGSVAAENLYSERDRVFDTLRDLQLEHATGKLSDGDYQLLRSRYDVKAAGILRQLDALEEATAEAREEYQCPRCHAKVQGDDIFCAGCGAHL
jgi:hypothetical protein